MFRRIVIALGMGVPMGAVAAPVQYECVLAQGGTLQFSFDTAQFAPPVSGDEPPRQQVADVLWRGETFRAEAVLMQGGAAGVFDGARGLLALVMPDGTLRVTEGAAEWTGRCSRRRSD